MSVPNPIIEVEQGELKGKACSTSRNVQYYAFKGVPYAKPPLGELRFAAPVPPEPWEGVRDATQVCNICAQLDKETNSVKGDEDCLYLNVYTPMPPSSAKVELLPVMIFLHGGGFVFGNGTEDSIHGPDFLIEKDVVVVSFNYRLGILGFLNLNRKDAPGNMGLKDQVFALKWVQKNIKKFGGDPDNVTIFGISAGGASVEYLVLSPMAKGLFHKAIAQSGSSLLPWAQNYAHKIKQLAVTTALLSGKPAQDDQLLKTLKELPTNQLIVSQMGALLADKFKGGFHFGFVPSIESPGDWEPFLNECTLKLLSNGEFTKVPYLSGFCSHEGLLMAAMGKSIFENFVKEKDFGAYIPFNIEESIIEFNNRCNAVYLEPLSDQDEPDSFGINFFTDVDFFGGISLAASLMAKNNSPVYFYEFAYDGGLNYLKKKCSINRKGACHGDDGGYIVKSNILPEATGVDKLIQDRITSMWTNFAKFGNPTPKTEELIPTIWEPMTETRFACLVIDDQLNMKYDIFPERMKLFHELYSKYYGSLGI